MCSRFVQTFKSDDRQRLHFPVLHSSVSINNNHGITVWCEEGLLRAKQKFEFDSTNYWVGPKSIHQSLYHWLLSKNMDRLKFHLARLDSTRHVRLCRASRASRDERVERDEPCSSNMANDERSCTSLVVFMLLHTQILFAHACSAFAFLPLLTRTYVDMLLFSLSSANFSRKRHNLCCRPRRLPSQKLTRAGRLRISASCSAKRWSNAACFMSRLHTVAVRTIITKYLNLVNL